MINLHRINYFLVICISFLFAVQVYFSNKLATSGDLLNHLEQQISQLEENNHNLMSQNVDQMSLHELSQKAVELGFIEPETIIDLNVNFDSFAYQN